MAGKLTLAVLAMAAVTGIMAASRERVFIMEVLMEKNEEVVRPVNEPNLPALVDQLGLSDLYGAVVSASLGEALSAKGPFTLFAPTNAAFAKDKKWVAKLSKNVTALRDVLTYHVLGGQAVMSKDIKDEISITSLNGKPIRFNLYPADSTKVVTAQCAPIDLKNVDKMASNGVLHELTALMVPPSGNIVEAAVGLKELSTLVGALKVASLVDTLSGKGPFTVFAPTNEAFKKLDPKILDYLLHNVTALTNVLTYHVVSLTYCSAGLQFYKELKMVNGQNTQISVNGDSIKINNIPVLPIGVEGSVTNGVIHKIESVLIPPSLQILTESTRLLEPYHMD